MKQLLMTISVLLSSFLIFKAVVAKEITTNQIRMQNAPDWVDEGEIEKSISKVENILEWSIRRVDVVWYSNQARFEQVHGLGSGVIAATLSRDQSVHLGPKVNKSNFEKTFAHELGHVIVFQKYKDAIPKWLNEGLANYVANRGEVNFLYLQNQKIPPIRTLVHPVKGGNIRLNYMVSTAVMQMIAEKCNLIELLQLSVGKNLDTYLGTYCEIKDLDLEFKNWVDKKTMPKVADDTTSISNDPQNQTSETGISENDKSRENESLWEKLYKKAVNR